MAWDLDKILKLIAICGAAVTFMWGLFQYFDGREREADVRRIEAMKPFLDRQLELYTEATQVTAAIAVSTDTAERTLALQRFWRLYYGELALVEDRSVEAAMVVFGRALQESRDTRELQQLALQLARACRESLAASWGVAAWRDPHSLSAETRREVSTDD
jgi:hypothetical protein